ncbi:MAG: AMP-binding protein [Thermomonas sp.]
MSAVEIFHAAGLQEAPVFRLVAGSPDRIIAIHRGEPVSAARFERHVRALAVTLPSGSHAVNLCEDRYRFLVALCAVAIRGQVNLLPPSRAPGVVAETLMHHPEAYALGDGPAEPGREIQRDIRSAGWRMPEVLAEVEGPPLMVDADAVVVIGFTSGSTGRPTSNAKSWGGFRVSTKQNLAALRSLWAAGMHANVVATVPAQHMYGIELSIMLPLLADVGVHGGRPFFPEDVACALRETPAPRLLVTTPVHLRALVESGVALPPLAGIVSATAPMPEALAREAESRYDCELREMFGSTETCVIACRRPALTPAWTPLPGVTVQSHPDGSLVYAAHLPSPVALADVVEVDRDGSFQLRGRQADLLEIAGKRASLNELTHRLLSVPGVEDGVVFQLEPTIAGGVGRIAALAVAPGMQGADILRLLRAHVDPVFLPRKLRCVATLPRNETGKLPRAELLRLLDTVQY